MSGPPATCDYLAFHAGHQPDAVALVSGAQQVTYAAFHRHRIGFTRALRRLGLAPGQRVAVSHPGIYIHWLLLLASEALGLVTASFLAAEEGQAAEPLLAQVDLVLAETALTPPPGTRVHRLTPEWIRGAFAMADGVGPGDEKPAAIGLERPVRVVRSSGTTGGQKMMLVTRRAQENQIDNYLRILRYTPATRFVFAHRFTINVVHLRATTCLRLGATCLTGIDWRELAARGCTDTWTQPVLLERLLDAMPVGFARPAAFRVEIGGAALPAALRARALAALASEVIGFYGSNEAVSICEIDSDGVGTVMPGVEVEIVDDDGKPVADGAVGQVRLRARTLIDGYLANPEADARMFRAGWFHPGDAARRLGPRRLRIIGRHDEVINLGGLKIAPDELEALLRRMPGVADAGVVPVHDAEGVQGLRLAFVCAPGAEAARVADGIRDRFPYPEVKLALRAVDAIPRTESGKVQRHRLNAGFEPEGGVDGLVNTKGAAARPGLV